ncbi:hypothetical protein HETIRDRAFT_450663 [Heterobasidion irregulare TC 32-1]|uniref:Uncharacterized protein n=1 Tax=Heterobasidion irregulare (strain TC 32-1) TaxID=747525 RepID=W4KAX8_HETIT|nr:uncharacterized protein HETIRDRAFT_450663 [Heterobasidion irregulare TC 32-1]ETW82943.1 hypothetical protein HETIRDRAFT_450663 [Heterobasidion irregulare TC 32-1]
MHSTPDLPPDPVDAPVEIPRSGTQRERRPRRTRRSMAIVRRAPWRDDDDRERERIQHSLHCSLFKGTPRDDKALTKPKPASS